MTSVIEAIGLIDALIGIPTRAQTEQACSDMAVRQLHSLGLNLPRMGGIATKGCGSCGGTMWRTVDDNGNGASQWVCGSCGAVE